MRPLARWTIGAVSDAGFECLRLSIESFTAFYDVDVVVCYNCALSRLRPVLEGLTVEYYDQSKHLTDNIKPLGVAWKLYPPRLELGRHEICIDNDIVFLTPVPEIGAFFNSDSTLLLECVSRTYGRFEKHVPPGYQINSGIYGMPPGFDFSRFVAFYARGQWEQNATGIHAASKTFDEQGLVATALLQFRRCAIIPNTIVTNCERQWVPGAACHFIGLNRRPYHEPYRLFRSQTRRMYL